MSTALILAELPRLSDVERREIVRRLIELEEDAQVLADVDRRADANFQRLDALEAQDDARKDQVQRNLADRSWACRLSGPCVLLSEIPCWRRIGSSDVP